MILPALISIIAISIYCHKKMKKCQQAVEDEQKRMDLLGI